MKLRDLFDDHTRRHFLKSTAGAVAAAQVGYLPAGPAASSTGGAQAAVEDLSKLLDLLGRVYAFHRSMHEGWKHVRSEKRLVAQRYRANHTRSDDRFWFDDYKIHLMRDLEQLERYNSLISLEDELFSNGRFSAIMERLNPYPGTPYMELDTGNQRMQLRDHGGFPQITILDHEIVESHGYKWGEYKCRCHATPDTALMDVYELIRPHLSTQEGRKAIYKKLPHLLPALQDPLRELLTAPASQSASTALQTMRANRYLDNPTVGRIRRHSGTPDYLSATARKDYEPYNCRATNAENPSGTDAERQTAPGTERTKAIDAWEKATGLRWRFVPGEHPHYAAEPAQAQRHRRLMNGIEMPSYVTAYRIAEIVNDRAAREGEAFELRADVQHERPEGSPGTPCPHGTVCLSVPARLFHDPAYAREVGERLRTDKKYAARWSEQARQCMERERMDALASTRDCSRHGEAVAEAVMRIRRQRLDPPQR